MERRTGFAVAGAVAMILVAGAIAAGANLGLLGAGRSSPVGHLKPADVAAPAADPSAQVVTVEVQDPAHAASARLVPSGDGTGQTVQVETIPVPAKATTSPASHEVEHETSTSSSGATADD